MKTRKKREKYYLVIDKARGYTHGAFPFTPEGKEMAEKFIKISQKEKKGDLIIKENG
jgi:hypothetical protein|tara:strand:- start:1069 stop:1239 length:171 start_codon:yes stop_codon:yes gene_type:complete